MPYSNIDKNDTETIAKMDSCVEKVMATGKDKQAAVAICYSSIVEGKPLAEAIFDYEAFMKTKVTEAEKPVKTENGKAYPKTAFAYTPSDNPGSWKLRLYADPGDDTPDTRIVGAAVAALGKGFRGSKVEIPDADLPAVKAKVKAAWKKANPDAKDEDLPEVLKEYGGDMPMATYADNFVPWGITSFADLEANQAAQKSAHEIGELTGQFQSLVGNIMGSPDITNKAQAVSTLTTEFIQKVTSITGEVTMEAETTTTAEVGKRVKGEMKNRLKEIKKQLDELMSWADYDDTDDPNSALEKPSAHKESELAQAVEFSESASGAAIDIAEDDAPPTVNDKRSPLKVNVRLIKPGWGNAQDKNWYGAEVLKRDAHLFEGLKMYPTDHKQDQKSAMNEVSVIEKITGFTDDGAPIARVNIFDPEFAEKTRNRAEAGQLNTLECSILAKGTARPGVIEGRKGNIVEAITEAHSVDWVTRAGAGGQALNLAESEKDKQTMTLPDGTQAPIAETETTTSPVATTTVTIAEGAPATSPAPVTPVALAEAEVNTLLNASTLPDEFKEIMRERQYKDQAEFAAYQTKMIERAKKLTGSGQPFGLGAPGSDRPKQVDPVKLAEVQDRVNAKYFGGK